jgi:large subunit ribosomal protein L4
VLSARATEGALTIVDSFTIETPKTKTLLETLAGVGVGSRVLVVLPERSDPVLRAAKNLGDVHVVTPNGLNLLDLLRLPRLILAEGAIQELTRTLTADLKPAEATVE